MVWKLKKLYTTFIQTTFPYSVVRLVKNRMQPKLFLESRLHRNFNLKQRYLTNQIRYGGVSRGIGKILKSSYFHKNSIIFGHVDFNWHWDKDRLLQKTDSERKRYTKPNYLFIDPIFNILNYKTCGHAHKVPALITKIQLTHKHNNKSTRHTKVHTTLLDLTWLNLTRATNVLLHRKDSNTYGRNFWGRSS